MAPMCRRRHVRGVPLKSSVKGFGLMSRTTSFFLMVVFDAVI